MMPKPFNLIFALCVASGLSLLPVVEAKADVMPEGIPFWTASETRTLESADGAGQPPQVSKSFVRYVAIPRARIQVGSVVYSTFPKKGSEGESTAQIADGVRRAMGFKAWERTRAVGNARVFESEYAPGNQFFRLFISETASEYRFSVGAFRKGYAAETMGEAEIIQRRLAGEMGGPQGRFPASFEKWITSAASALIPMAQAGDSPNDATSPIALPDNSRIEAIEAMNRLADSSTRAEAEDSSQKTVNPIINSAENAFGSALGSAAGAFVIHVGQQLAQQVFPQFYRKKRKNGTPEAERLIQDFEAARRDYERIIAAEKTIEAALDNFILHKLLEQKIGKQVGMNMQPPLSPLEGAVFLQHLDQQSADACKTNGGFDPISEARLKQWGKVVDYLAGPGGGGPPLCDQLEEVFSRLRDLEYKLQRVRVKLYSMARDVLKSKKRVNSDDAERLRKENSRDVQRAREKERREALASLTEEAKKDIQHAKDEYVKNCSDKKNPARRGKKECEKEFEQLPDHDSPETNPKYLDVAENGKRLIGEEPQPDASAKTELTLDETIAQDDIEDLQTFMKRLEAEQICVLKWRHARAGEVNDPACKKTWNVFKSLQAKPDASEGRKYLVDGKSRQDILRDVCKGREVTFSLPTPPQDFNQTGVQRMDSPMPLTAPAQSTATPVRGKAGSGGTLPPDGRIQDGPIKAPAAVPAPEEPNSISD